MLRRRLHHMQQAFEDQSSRSAPRIQSVDRAIRLLKAIADSPVPLTLADARRAAGVNPSTAWRLLATLRGPRPRGAQRRRLRRRLLRRADRRVGRRDTRSRRPPGRCSSGSSSETQEAVSLSVPRHRTIVSIDHIAAPRVVSAGWVGEQLPLHCTSNGKLLLASWLPEDELAAFLRRPLTALTPATITDPRRAARRAARRIRERAIRHRGRGVRDRAARRVGRRP